MASLRDRFLARPSLEELKKLEKRKPLVIQERDIEILRLLFEHRLMNLRQLEYLLGADTEGKKQALRRRLRQLYIYHLIDQPEDSLYLRLKYREDPEYNTSIYGIGSRGITTLARELGWDLEKSKRKRTNERYFLFLQHSLYLSQFYTVLALALRKREDFEILGWKEGRAIETKLPQVDPSSGYRLETKSDRPSLRPDAFFCLHNKERDELAFFFLEADLSGQQRLPTMVDKYRKYWQFWQQGLYQSFGIEEGTGFQVLTFCKQKERVKALLNIFDSYLPWRELPREKKPNMFCFTDSFGSYEEPEPILGEIWVSPRGERFSILD
jgi:hypothetical protein